MSKAIKPKIELDYSLIEDAQITGIDNNDAPDYCDSYIFAATYDGRPMTEDELDVLNEDSEFVYQALINKLY